MSHKIHNISNQTTFLSEAGETILQAALRNGQLYPYGCQAGACGACKSKLIKGEVEYLSRDASVLSDDELAAGFCLTCQAVPQEDVELDVKVIAKVKEIQIKSMPTRVREKNLLTGDVVQLFLSLPNTQKFDFLPGQYLNILLANGKQRSFSMANTPERAHEEGIELHIRVIDDGYFSPKVKQIIEVKDILRIQGPFGTYFLRKDEKKPIILVAGGTGFAPIKALIDDAIESGFSEPISLYWGARTQEDIYLADLPKQWAKTLPNFTFIPVLSQQEADSDWDGATGFVHQAILDQHTDLSGHSVYASGPPVMIEAIQKSLPSIGLDIDFLYTDAFDYAAQSE